MIARRTCFSAPSRKTRFTILLRLSAALLAGLLPAAAQPDSSRLPRPPSLVVSLTLQTDCDPATLSAAVAHTARILRQAGLDATIAVCGETPAHPACDADLRSPRLWLRLTRQRSGKRLATPGNVFGRAFLDAGNRPGSIADVFVDRVRRFASQQDVDEAVLLGHVFAHEIGHLLLDRAAHPIAGVMSAEWRRRQLVKAGHGRLVFSRRESRAMRLRVAERMELARAAEESPGGDVLAGAHAESPPETSGAR